MAGERLGDRRGRHGRGLGRGQNRQNPGVLAFVRVFMERYGDISGSPPAAGVFGAKDAEEKSFFESASEIQGPHLLSYGGQDRRY